MTQIYAPWSIKGIDPRARAAAKQAAQAAGLTLGAWLNQRLLEDRPARPPAPAPEADPPRPLDAAMQGLTLLADRLERMSRAQAEERRLLQARLEQSQEALARIGARLNALEQRSSAPPAQKKPQAAPPPRWRSGAVFSVSFGLSAAIGMAFVILPALPAARDAHAWRNMPGQTAPRHTAAPVSLPLASAALNLAPEPQSPPPARAFGSARRAAAPAAVDNYLRALSFYRRGKPEDRTRAAELFARAAAEDFPPAQFWVASFYELGIGFERNLWLARQFYAAAAAAGHLKAMHNLAIFSLEGWGGSRDLPAARRQLRRAARHGAKDSMLKLALIHQQNQTDHADPARAYAWRLLAVKGDTAADPQLHHLARRMSQSQLIRAYRLARAFRPAAPDPLANGEPAALARAHNLAARLP